MNYKLIAVDLDDSLLGTDLEISNRNKEALIKAMEKGVLVTIATGRMFISALRYAHQLGLDVPIITYQGGLIKNAFSKDVLYNKTLPMDICRRIIHICKEKSLHLQIYIGDEYYFEEDNKYSNMYYENIGVKGQAVGPLDKFSFDPPNKLLIIDEPDIIGKLRNEFAKIFDNQIEVTTSKPEYLEFTHKDATKGKALEYLANLKGINRENVIAIGDSYNDISMLQYAGLGVAMGNSPEYVKSHADYITGINDEDGVAQAIDKFVLERS
ncbi:MAG: Cof-type HAD-IIB family hydrolase [Caldicoprobacterales bacterium]|nr:HAD family phosphatase [Clostridiales bacterium]